MIPALRDRTRSNSLETSTTARPGPRAFAAAIALAAIGLCIGVAPAQARVLGVDVAKRERVLGGRAFGERGAYELITGVIRFGFDPSHEANRAAVDLELAPKNAQGLVEADADFLALQPVDVVKRRGVALVEAPNRGMRVGMGFLNRATGGMERGSAELDPNDPAAFGDGFLLRQGLTLVWIGWQFDAPGIPGSLRIRVPVARNADGSAIRGLVRSDFVIEAPAMSLPLAAMGHRAYPAAAPDDPRNQLTLRDGRDGKRSIVPRARWRFARDEKGVPVPDPTQLYLDGGFELGRIYELVYVAEDPPVAGLGLAALRDVAAYAKHDPKALFPAQASIAFGVSQSGRLLRHFLYEGWNGDEQNRPVYDALLIAIAGAGRGSFNHRFAQPGLAATRFRSFHYPVDLFPFTLRPQKDPVTQREDTLLAGIRTPDQIPLTIQLNSSYEYWGRAGSLTHVSADGAKDVPITPVERQYLIAGAAHRPTPFPPSAKDEIAPGIYRGNSVDPSPMLRAILARTVEWATGGPALPGSRIPSLAKLGLARVSELAHPKIPGLSWPSVAHTAHPIDFGPQFAAGIIDKQPPDVGAPFVSLVPVVDEFGNDRLDQRPLELAVPIATYLPWCLRTGMPGPQDELMDFIGTTIPLAKTDAIARERGDTRPSLASRYPSREAYLDLVKRAAQVQIERGYLLAEDLAQELERAGARWDWVQSL
jgi:hypothetical protein